MEPEAYAALAEKVVGLAHQHECKVLLTGAPALVEQLGADGLHLDSKALESANQRPLPEPYLLAVSGHTLDALQKGEALNVDFAVLSPIQFTKAHPDIEPLGWKGLNAIAAQVKMPVFALGGVSASDEGKAIEAGAQGVAGSRGYWNA